MKKGYLVLADGTVFEGRRFGAEGSPIGELVFTTGVVGYVETLTDPCYFGQLVMQTFPMIGNYGIAESDFAGKPCAAGYIVRQWCEQPSNFRSQYDIDTFLKAAGIPGLYGIDTRALTRHIREKGTMNALICDELPADLTAVGAHRLQGAVAACSCRELRTLSPEGEVRARAAVLDLGAPDTVCRELLRRGAEVVCLPADTTAEQVLSLGVAGLLLSPGPGDPADADCSAVAALAGQLPIFGIGLGHQVLARALGGTTYKLSYGHRGASQPVTAAGGNTGTTTQNHGYAVDPDSLKGTGEVSFYNENDRTCEGMEYAALRAFSVQFAPESCTVPHDFSVLYDRFVDMMGGK